mgnify:CR=1 FL=1
MTSVHDRTSQFLEGIRRNRRQLMSPEGVPLPIEIADMGERATAFVLDLFIWLCASLVIYLLLVFIAIGGLSGHVFIALMLFVGFLVRNFYFIQFELAWQGATPGKRIVGLRVIDRHGGPLQPSAIIARNLTREMEAFLPLGILLTLGGSGAGAWEKLALAGWMIMFSALPLFNRDRLRGGDLIAGTMVIALPRRLLLADLVERTSHFSFSDRQLGAYGAFELQILEELLRRPAAPDSPKLYRDVCDRIGRKIAWPTPVADADCRRFLSDFYTAERAWLEREQLFGREHADKHQGETGRR